LGASLPNPDPPFCPGNKKWAKNAGPNAARKPIYNKKRPPKKLAPQSLRSDSFWLMSFLIVNVPAEWAEEKKRISEECGI